MYLLMIAWLMQPQVLTQEAAIAAVRDGHLSFNSGRSVGQTLAINPWYSDVQWQASLAANEAVVDVTVALDDAHAVTQFMADNEYAFRKNFKAMQLESVYGLIGERDAVRLKFRFKVLPDHSFETLAGSMLVLHRKDQQWQEKPLSNKAIVEILRGIYARENPFESFVRGLPFK